MTRSIFIIMLLCAAYLGFSPEATAQYNFHSSSGQKAQVGQQSSSGDIVIKLNEKEKMRVMNDGSAKIMGPILPGVDATCNAASEGTLQYNSGANTWQFCNGSGLTDLLAASSACSSSMMSYPFYNLENVAKNTLITSDFIRLNTISGGCGSLPISISGTGNPQYRICSVWNCSTVVVDWGNAPSTISANQYLQLRMTSAAALDTASIARVTIGMMHADWQVKTSPKAYKVFVTSTTYNGGFGGREISDFVCNQRANAAGLTGYYKSWIGTQSSYPDPEVGPKDVFDISYSYPFEKTDGTKIANNWSELTDSGGIESAIDRDEFGNTISGTTHVWTSVYTGGSGYSADCSGWKSTSGSGYYGVTNLTDISWMRVNTDTCATLNRLYCVEQESGTADLPTGTPGVDYKRVFITPTTYNGNLGNVTGADTKCQTAATTAGLSGTYKAWISGTMANTAPATRFTQSTVPYRNVNGPKIADNWADLIDGSALDAPIIMSPTGTLMTGTSSWSNTTTSGTMTSSITTSNCNNWANSGGASFGRTVVSSALSPETTSVGCGGLRYLTCYEQ